MNIPDAAVEAAARASYELIGVGWDSLDQPEKDEWRAEVTVDLAAAAPHIAAQALSDAADELQNAYPAATRRLREIEARHRNEARNG